MTLPKTFGELKESGYNVISVKDEVRKNLIKKIQNNETVFEGIIGYEETVIPEIENAILSKHDFILLGLRGQAKTKILRSLTNLLDEKIPIIKGSEVNDNPFAPISKFGKDKIEEWENAAEIEWISRDFRYNEKLATPDVTIADLIGDIDPIKAASQRLHYSNEGVIHFGILPRTNRGIFAINEIPDLQQRIQVGLLNILEEKDIQIRGFPIRFPIDAMIVFSANPEDYTNRGSIITPLKDRISSQIITHYPHKLEDAIQISDQESWTKRKDSNEPKIPQILREVIELVTFEARQSEFIDQKSGVSSRMAISCIENVVSNSERRIARGITEEISIRTSDLWAMVSAITGKIELVFEGEEQGVEQVAKGLIGKAIQTAFNKIFPPVNSTKSEKTQHLIYNEIILWFGQGNSVEVHDLMTVEEYFETLDKIPTLKSISRKYFFKQVEKVSQENLASAMEFVLEGLFQSSKIGKFDIRRGSKFRDLAGSYFDSIDFDFN